jgi:hypothetical protein
VFKKMELEAKQAERDRLRSLGRDARRRDAVRRALEASPGDIDDLRHIHSVLAVCGLPYTRQPLEVREYERRQGRMSLIVEAGKLRNPTAGDREAQPLPGLSALTGARLPGRGSAALRRCMKGRTSGRCTSAGSGRNRGIAFTATGRFAAGAFRRRGWCGIPKSTGAYPV